MSIEGIQMAVAERYGVMAGEMIGDCGEPRIKRPRQVAMYLARKYTTASLPDIAAAFRKTTATVINATREIDAQVRLDRALESEIEDLRKRLMLDREPAESHSTRVARATLSTSSGIAAPPQNVKQDNSERAGVEIVSKNGEVVIKISIR